MGLWSPSPCAAFKRRLSFQPHTIHPMHAPAKNVAMIKSHGCNCGVISLVLLLLNEQRYCSNRKAKAATGVEIGGGLRCTVTQR